MSKHIEEFRIYVRTRQFDITSVNETMLDNSIFNTEIAVHGYELVRNDRHRHGGGVALYIRDSINYKIRNDLAIASLETVTVEIFKPKAKSFLINTWYRPPNTPIDLFEDYEICIKKMDAEDKEPICIGDFNCDCLLRKNNLTLLD